MHQSKADREKRRMRRREIYAMQDDEAKLVRSEKQKRQRSERFSKMTKQEFLAFRASRNEYRRTLRIRKQ